MRSAYSARPAWSGSSSCRAWRGIRGFGARGWRRASAPKASPTRPSRRGAWRRRFPSSLRRPHRRGVRARTRTEGRVLRSRRVGGRRHRTRLRGRRSHRRQQRAQLPDGSARPAADSRSQRRSPEPARRTAQAKGWTGAIVTNPNCSTIVLAMALAPLRAFDLRAVIVSTMQAVSGAGYPGVPSLDILGNVVPFIGGEEEKMRERDAEDSRQRRRPHAVCRRRQRAHQSRAP